MIAAPYTTTLFQFSRIADIALPELEAIVARFGYKPVGKKDGEDCYSLENLFAALRRAGHTPPILGIPKPREVIHE